MPTITTAGAANARAFGFSGAKLAAIVDYLIVAGGGGTGAGENEVVGGASGGGGAGGVLTGTQNLYFGRGYTITIGAGGASGDGNIFGDNGSNTTALNLVAIGGGRGVTSAWAVGNGGSGGGGGSSNVYFGGTGTAGQGYAGGNGAGNTGCSGGGGGASEVGGDAVSSPNKIAGNGGDGIEWPASSGVYYGGGGGGSCYISSGTATAGTGGLGGGGNGAIPGNYANGYNGSVNTGGGGGGGVGPTVAHGGVGGSGVFIIRYPNTYPDATTIVGSPTYTNTGGYKTYKFTSSGYIRF